MTCRDYRRAWDLRLDAREADPSELAEAMAAHESACESCRALGRRYRALSRSIESLGPPPPPPVGFARRFAPGGDLETLVSTRRTLRERPAARYAAAAALVLLGLIAVRGHRARVRPDKPGAPIASRGRPLADSLADASSATWELAKAASGPAARVGRDAIPSGPGWVLAAPAVVEPAESSRRPWSAGGGQAGVGVRPLGWSARRAFGFLLGPMLRAEKPGRGPEPPPDPRRS